MPHKYPVLHFPLRQRLGRWWQKLRRKLRMDHWFPHLPVAVAAALLGLLSLFDGISRVAPAFPAMLRMKPVLHIGQIAAMRGLGGLPEAAAGAVLLAMSFGLAFRSRLAWVIALIISAATLSLMLHQAELRWGALTALNGVVLVALIIFYRYFSKSSLAAGTMFSLISVLLLLGYSVFGSFVLGQGFSPPITNLVGALYFSVVTLSTVGYGDIVPKTSDARFFVISMIILGITVFATSISAVIVPLVNGRMQRLLAGEKKRMRQDHYIVIGDNALAHNTYRELKTRHLAATVILSNQPENPWMAPDDLVVGDASDIETLRKAGGDKALAILALRADDSENAFIVMAAKELGGKARTVAAVKDSKNLQRVRRVGPDLIIAPDILGGELLAMAISGEELSGDNILKNLFITTTDASVPQPAQNKT
ncbi:MAG: voltage-gated potassium channel protein [Planctomycetes bacterium]|jgi:voltage-gated potassium channel|nr:voltage-gated potassium channel protein [Planctomycetota bacterium]MDA8377004.1 voltage-gated potassium channel protein [Planctomycetia bacterium]